MSPAEGELGSVTVIAPPVVLIKYPLPDATVKGEVLAGPVTITGTQTITGTVVVI